MPKPTRTENRDVGTLDFGRLARRIPGYYDNCSYLSLYVLCGQQLLCAYLQPSDTDGARHAGAILKQ